ncbi:putative membrane protein, partial [Thermoanaerobacterium thermosaccharolyticum]|nr:putative membrane protein [Thermoanaerobacterium thermosaccharolyticum]
QKFISTWITFSIAKVVQKFISMWLKFLLTFTGLLKKRKYGYFLALYLYAILIIYYLMAIAYLIINQQYFLAFYCIAVMVVFYMIINYVRKNKSEFTK